MRWLAALLLLAPQQELSAEALFKAMRERIEGAKTIRAELRSTADQGGAEYVNRHSIKIKGADRWVFDHEFARASGDGFPYQKFTMLYNGRRLVVRGKVQGMNQEAFKAGEWGGEIRRLIGSGYTNRWFTGEEAGKKPPAMGPIKDLGKSKVGEREARGVEFAVKYDLPEVAGQEMKVRIFIDPVRQLPLKRETDWFGATWTETFPTLVLDEDLPDSEFSGQSLQALAKARAAQLAASVRLFGLYTGRHPGRLEDLAKRPADLEAGIFWPSRGFLLGGAVPLDPWGKPFELVAKGGRVSVVSRGGGGEAAAEVPIVTRRAVGAPSERLEKYYAARVEVQLLAAAVRAYRDAYGELPRKRASLWERPEWAEVWPEGGWLPGGTVPVDPWGEPYRIISDEEYVRVQVRDPKAVALGSKSVTAEEHKALEEIARPRLSEDERKAVGRLFDQLGEDDLEARERAEGELKAWGPAIVPMLEERLKREKDGEAILRLGGVRKGIPSRRAAWMSELVPLSVTVRAEAGGEGGGAGDERMASACLKTLATAQADFRSNDRDNNRVNDFWTGDVASLYALVPAGGTEPIKLIELSVAAADGAPLEEGAAIEKFAERQPKAGYHFRMMLKDNSGGTPQEYQQDTDGKGAKTRNTSRFGICAYPAEYGVTGTRTYILNEGNTIFCKDTGGEPVLEWPGDGDLARGWQKLD